MLCLQNFNAYKYFMEEPENWFLWFQVFIVGTQWDGYACMDFPKQILWKIARFT